MRKLASHASVLVVGIGLGIGAVAVADSGPPARSAASDSRIVNQLRTMNSELGSTLKDIDKRIGTPQGIVGIDSLMEGLDAICKNTAKAAGESPSSC